MVRGLLINLAITTLASAILFLYFRNRFKVVEHKVNSIFQLVQNHIQRPNRFMPQFPNNIPKPMPVQEDKVNLIEVSDDSASSDSESESSSSEEENDTYKQETTNVPTVSPEPVQINLEDDDEDDSLSELTDDTEVKEEEIKNITVEPTLLSTQAPNVENNLKRLTVAELKKMAGDRGLKKFSKFNKTQLVDLLAAR